MMMASKQELKAMMAKVMDLQNEEPQALIDPRTGRWFITMGNPGFNSPANNRRGYLTKGHALKAVRYYTNKGKRARGEV